MEQEILTSAWSITLKVPIWFHWSPTFIQYDIGRYQQKNVQNPLKIRTQRAQIYMDGSRKEEEKGKDRRNQALARERAD